MVDRAARSVRSRDARRLGAAFGLTAREAEVLYWVIQGKTNRDIGDILGASPATVKKHLEHVFGKLGVENAHRGGEHGDEQGARLVGVSWV
jgi:DNA-binding CsgD family transcriptional regulator